MQYRPFGKLDFQVSALGFGAMRLPTQDGKIDEPEAPRMLRYAIDHGVNYVDSAYPYHGGNSERVRGQRAPGRLPGQGQAGDQAAGLATSTGGQTLTGCSTSSSSKLQTDHVDFYLLHGLRLREAGPRCAIWACSSGPRGRIADGRIGHLGFSFHDELRCALKEIVDAYDGWTMCQIQYNYMDVENQAGTQGLQYAASKGLAVVIMEPLLGGKLTNPPEPCRELWDGAPRAAHAGEWALQWLWNQPEVSIVLSGMSTMEQVEQNVASAERLERVADGGGPGAGGPGARGLSALCAIPCTQCRYCMPCPNGVDIPYNFKLYNDGLMYEGENTTQLVVPVYGRSRRLRGGLSPRKGTGC